MNLKKIKTSRKGPSGQTLVLFVLCLTVMFFFCGLGIDAGLMYLTKAKLSRSVDGVALRVTKRFDQQVDTRLEMAIRTMKANLGQVDMPSWHWDSIPNGSANTQIANGSDAKGFSMNVTSVQSTVGSDVDVVAVTVTASIRHRTYFMLLGGKAFEEVTLSSVATAERFPGIIALVLDVSGSMRGTGTGSNWYRMVEAAKQFVQSDYFSDARDRFLIVTYGTRALPIYPAPDSSGNVLPQKNYRAPAVAALNKFNDSLRPTMGFNGSTSASEGMRVAFESVENYLASLGDKRDNFKVSYVFLTDGDFNTLRTWAVGRGYGWPTGETNASYSSDSSFQDTYEGKPGTRVVPSWHGKKLINASTDTGKGWGQLTSFKRNGDSSGGTAYNLSTLFNKSFDSMKGINVAIHAQTYNVPGGSASFGLWGMKQESGAFWPSNWFQVIYNNDGTFYIPKKGNGTNQASTDVTTSPTDDNYMRWSSGTPANNYYNAETMGRIRWEMLQSRYGYLLSLPEPIWSDTYNPTKTSSATNRSNANMTTDWLNFYGPAGRIYGNFYGAPTKASGGVKGAYVERTASDGMTNTGQDSAYDSMNRAFARLTDFYPAYHYGLTYNDLCVVASGDSATVQTQKAANKSWLENVANWNRTANSQQNPNATQFRLGNTDMVNAVGFPRYIYRPSTGTWVKNNMHSGTLGGYSSGNSLDGTFLDEGNFLTEAQCYIARMHHKASVYTIGYNTGTGPAEVLTRMANQNSPFPLQKEGLFQQANSSNISDVFQLIASKIAVSITQ